MNFFDKELKDPTKPYLIAVESARSFEPDKAHPFRTTKTQTKPMEAFVVCSL